MTFYSSKNPAKRFHDSHKILSSTTLTIIQNVSWAPNHYIIMISDHYRIMWHWRLE